MGLRRTREEEGEKGRKRGGGEDAGGRKGEKKVRTREGEER